MSVPDRRALLDHDHAELSIRRQCQLLGIARSGVYYERQPGTLQNSEEGVVNALARHFAVKVVRSAPLPFCLVLHLEFRDAVVAADEFEHDQNGRCFVEVILTIDDFVEVWIRLRLSMGVG